MFGLAFLEAFRPTCARITVFGMSPEWYYRKLRFLGIWTLPTCSNMSYTTLFPTIVCLVWPLEASEAQMSPDKPRWVFLGCPQSDIIVKCDFWVCWTLSTCSNMSYTTLFPTIVCLVWPLAASRGPNESRVPNEYFRDVPRVISSWFITFGPVLALPQHRERCPVHSGPVWPLNSS